VLQSNRILLGMGVVCGIGYIGYLQHKINKFSSMIELTVDNISAGVEVNINEDMLQLAIEKAVDREASYISNRVSRELGFEIRNRVKDSVKDSAETIKDEVSIEIKRQVKNIDISDMEREVIRQAKDAVAEKFDKKLDGLLEDFNENLSNVQKIYSSIANSMAK